MSNPEQHADAEDRPEDEANDTVADHDEPTPEGDEAPDVQAQLEDAQATAQRHFDDLLRVRAEMENLRKRNLREVEKARKFGIERFATDLLLVSDSLEQGLAATDDSSVGQLREGMELTLKMLDKVLKDHGIEVIDPLNQPFDPELHEAMSMVPGGAEHEPDTVMTVVQKGYLLNERLIRPARVVVAKAS